MTHLFTLANNKFNFDGRGTFNGIQLNTNDSFNLRKSLLVMYINGEEMPIQSDVERSREMLNDKAVIFEYASDKPFTFRLDGIVGDEIITMLYDVAETPVFLGN